MSDIVAIYAVFGSDEEARRIGRDMIERRLAACVNILGPCHSIYRWQGKVEEAGEVAAIFKTGSQGVATLIAAISDAHSYDVPAIAALPVVDTPGDYARWVESESGGPAASDRSV